VAIPGPNSTTTTIYTNVPAAASTGLLSVTVNGQTGSSKTAFTLAASTAVVGTLAGSAGSSGWADGNGPAARFAYRANIAVDAYGNSYVSEDRTSIIRKITSDGTVTTLAGQALTYGSTTE